MTFLFASAREWYLEIPPPIQSEAWEQSQRHGTPKSRWNAYLNKICLVAVLKRIQSDNIPEASAWLSSSRMSSIWEVVNGSAITIESKKIVLIPTEAIDDGELEVPQEWVDIPSWAGDYYITVQVRPEVDGLRVWGYTTHQELKEKAVYDASVRAYCIDAEDLTRDMDSLWVKYRLYSQVPTRVEVAPLAELSTTQAENLIQRLSNLSILFPRLSVPFATWGALLENENWRSSLYELRLGLTANRVSEQFTRLSNWLASRFDTVWQAIEDIFPSQQAVRSWRNNQNLIFDIERVKVLDFGADNGSEQVALLIGVSPVNGAEVSIGVQVLPTGNNIYLPNAVQTRLLDENGDEVGQASAGVTQTIKLQFEGQIGEKFSIEVTCGSRSITEAFVI